MPFSQAVLSLFLVALFGVAVTKVESFSFSFANFQQQDRAQIALTRTANIFLNAIQVTADVRGLNISDQSGRALYNRPFRLWKKGKKASFNTTFVLNIMNQTNPGGEGLAFVITGHGIDNAPANSDGFWMGIVNPQLNGSSQAQIVAVEFDTRKSYPEDIDDNHVGLDINSIYSVRQVSLNSYNVSISRGVDLKVRIEYDRKNLSVFVGNETEKLVFSEPIDLSVYLPEEVFVGFSASTGQFTQLNCVKSWEFIGSNIKSRNLLWVWIVVPVGSVLLIGIGIFLYRKRRSGNEEMEDAYPNIEEAIRGSSTAPKKFHLKELRKATGNFNSRNKLGKGGFGTVYKGTLGDRVVAVKRVSEKSTQGKTEFIAEVITIGNLRHRNLVKLIGWCYEKKEYLLVYEFMPNSSLDKFIFNDGKLGFQESTLSWGTRLNIISGVAQALDYLHHGCDKTVLHRDIKASNIMLDSEFTAKLGDFGLARTILVGEQTHHSTKELAGTPGYMAPECILTGRATVETDVYAFGVLVLEVACGRKPGSQSEQNDYSSFIVNWLWELHRTGRIVDGADLRLKGDFESEDMECVLILGLACCHPNPNNRPPMKLVLQVLSGEAQPPMVPGERPSFVWPPLPPSFKDLDYSLNGSQLSPFTEVSGR